MLTGLETDTGTSQGSHRRGVVVDGVVGEQRDSKELWVGIEQHSTTD